MSEAIEYVTAETERGRQAILAAMEHSYSADLDNVPEPWTVARLVNSVPVAWIQVDPDRRIDFPGACMRYGFIMNVATHREIRRKGHFRGIMEHTFAALHAARTAAVVTHGRYELYRQFGFEVFTHHSGIFARPEIIERSLGPARGDQGRDLLVIEKHRAVRADLLLVSDVRAVNLEQCKAALQAAAATAKQLGKTTILFEQPVAPSYGSRYPIHDSPRTPFGDFALACGADSRLQGSNPEGSSIPDADWIKVLDAAQFVREALVGRAEVWQALPQTAVSVETDAGAVSVESLGDEVMVSRGIKPHAAAVMWPSSALAQLVTGYRAAGILAALHDTNLSSDTLALLAALFPRCWRFTRNEGWAFSS
jgi:hypothetical protein